MNAFKLVIHILNTDLKSSTKTMQKAKDQHCHWASVLKKNTKKEFTRNLPLVTTSNYRHVSTIDKMLLQSTKDNLLTYLIIREVNFNFGGILFPPY